MDVGARGTISHQGEQTRGGGNGKRKRKTKKERGAGWCECQVTGRGLETIQTLCTLENKREGGDTVGKLMRQQKGGMSKQDEGCPVAGDWA